MSLPQRILLAAKLRALAREFLVQGKETIARLRPVSDNQDERLVCQPRQAFEDLDGRSVVCGDGTNSVKRSAVPKHR